MDTNEPRSPEDPTPPIEQPTQEQPLAYGYGDAPSGRERRRTFTRIAVAGGVAAVGLSIGGIAVATAGDEDTDRGPGLFVRHGGEVISDELAERLAESLGLDEDKVADALEDVRDELGRPERLDDLRDSLRDGELPSPPTEEELEARQDELAAALAEALGVDAAEVEAALEEVRAQVEADMEERFAEFREEARADLVERLDAAVEDGTLTEADKESVLKAYDEGVLDGPGPGPFGHFRWGGGPFGDGPADDEQPSTSS